MTSPATGRSNAEPVSVVIPLFQKAAHVQRALDSILTQEFGDLEVIVVDDGSTDGGGEVVRRCTDSRVKLVTQRNKGAGAARNRGVAEASSSLVAFLDADDEWELDFLYTALLLRSQFPEAAVFGTSYRLVLPTGEIRLPRFHGRLPPPAGSGIIDYFAGDPGNAPLHSSAVMVKKEALLASGGFAEGVDLGEDHDTWIRLALRYPIAWSWNPAVTLHLEAENRSDSVVYHGNFPFFESVQAFRRARGLEGPFSEELSKYLVWRHTSLLAANLLAGNRAAIRQIVSECRMVQADSLRFLFWSLLSTIPTPLIWNPWRLYRWIARRMPVVPRFRSIYRASGTDGQRVSMDSDLLEGHGEQ